jgi:hypothetical protein
MNELKDILGKPSLQLTALGLFAFMTGVLLYVVVSG